MVALERHKRKQKSHSVFQQVFQEMNRWFFFFDRWLETKRDDDNVEDGLWRIRDTLYDLTDFILKHPGGPDWLNLTKGHDITEAFITHHVSFDKMQPILAKYRVRDTMRPRNVKLTFHEDGFYMTLKRKVAAKLPELKKHTKIYSNVSIDIQSYVARTFSLVCLSLKCIQLL